jgi:serine/threonine-protein kinase RsbW
MNAPPEIAVELSSNPAYLCGVRELVNLVSRRLGFADGQASKIALAVDEALANVMNHGYQRRTDGRIWVRIYRVEDSGAFAGFRIIIEDEGRQVDPSEIKSRDLADIRPGGLGVHIIREVMDTVHYEKRESAGMRLTMVKLLGTGARVSGSCCSDSSGGGCRG